MLNKREKKVLITLDIVELLLLFIALIIFTIVFKIVEEPIRFVFLIGDIFVITSFSKSLTRMEEMLEKRKEIRKKSQLVSEISV